MSSLTIVSNSALRCCAKQLRRALLATGRQLWVYDGDGPSDIRVTDREIDGRLICTYTEVATVDWIAFDLFHYALESGRAVIAE